MTAQTAAEQPAEPPTEGQPSEELRFRPPSLTALQRTPVTTRAMARRLPQLVCRSMALAWKVDRTAVVALLVCQALGMGADGWRWWWLADRSGVASAAGAERMPPRRESHQQNPARTVRTARTACPRGTPAMLIRDRLDALFEDEVFADLFSVDGRPGLSPGQLAMVSVVQFAENLSDRAAPNAATWTGAR